MNYLIPKDVLQKVINYLSTRPWHEANQLIPTLAQLTPAPEDKPQAPAESK